MAQAKAASQPNVLERFVRYLKDVRAELRRVVWPTRQEVLNSSLVVITALFIFGVFVFVVDQLSSVVILEWLAKIGR